MGKSVELPFCASMLVQPCIPKQFTLVAKTIQENIYEISARIDGGARSPSSHDWRVLSSPHQHECTFFGACVCKVTFKSISGFILDV